MGFELGKRTQIDGLAQSSGSNSPIPGKRTQVEQIAPTPSSAVIQTGGPTAKTTCVPGDDTAPAQEAVPERVQEMTCPAGGPVAPDALSGIKSWLAVDPAPFRDELIWWGPEGLHDPAELGPGNIGPYTLWPYLKHGKVYCYVAEHNQRYQREWVVGVDSADAFVATAPLYARTAAKMMPLRDNAPGSPPKADPHIADVLELDAFHEAPWPDPTRGADPAASDQDTQSSTPDGAGNDDHPGRLVNAAGSAANAARNAHIRLDEYVQPAKQMARELRAQLDAGELDHMALRQEAVEGRNAMMEGARARMSPGARQASKAMKETGKTVGEMTSRKVTQLIDQSRSIGLRPGQTAGQIQEQLAADSALWAEYAGKLDGGASAETYAAALERLGDSRAVSRAIIESAGNSNKLVTGFARFSRVGGAVVAAGGAGEMIYDIVSAPDGQRLHVAARDLAGFTSGLIGGEMGTGAGAWFASLLPLAEGSPVGLVVTVIAGIAGATLGSAIGPSIMQGAADVAVGGLARTMPGMMAASGGGFEGMYEREQRENDPNFQKKVEDAVWILSDDMKTLEKRIADAKDDNEQDQLQRLRFEVMQRRTTLETVLTAIHLGTFDTSGTAGGACASDEDQP